MNSFYNKKRRRGYTLAEVLATVAILLILMAIAVPAIFAIRKNLRQKALDNKAELIYTAVQNNLVKMQNNGNSALFAKGKATQLTANPSDADGDKRESLYYVTSADKTNTGNAASVLVTTDTVDTELYDNYWVVEYNPDSASVYAVFYSETRSDYTTGDYNVLRYKKARLNDGARVGYYGGDMINSGSTSTLAPTLTITNEEKLVATISCKRPDSNDLLFEVKLTDGENHTLTLRYKPSGDKLVHQADDMNVEGAATAANEAGAVRGIRYELKLTLDSLEDGQRFYELYGKNNNKIINANNRLTPGTSLSIHVTVKSAGAFADSAEAEAVTNSLFADESTETLAVVKYGRHLQNLDAAASGVTSRITEAEQRKDIHFEKQDDVEDGDTSSWYSCYTDPDTGKERTFTPITNGNLKKYSANYTGENGNTPVIYHLTVENQEKAGLFATLADGITVDSVKLSGAKISGDGSEGSVAGALAGETAGKATITNCQVFLSSKDVAGKTADDYWISNAAVAGGLIGRAKGAVVIEKSLAATVMSTIDIGSTADNAAGGLVGIVNKGSGTTKVTNSYADSYIRGKVVGGLIARALGGAQITYCYTVGYLAPKTQGGGFLAEGTATNTTVSYCYTGISWVKYSSEQDTAAGNYKTYSIAPAGVTKSYYIEAGNQHEENTSGSPDGRATQITYDKLSNRAEICSELNGSATSNFTSTVPVTNAYNLKNQGLTGYSYPALAGLPHYGDWQADFEAGSLVYYEVYQEDNGDLSYGFFGGNISSTLSDTKTVVGDGYGIVYEADSSSIPKKEINITYETSDGSEKSAQIPTKSSATSGINVISYKVTSTDENGNNKAYVIYPLPSEIVNASAIADSYYQKLTIYGENAVGGAATADISDVISGDVYYYNPHFAKSAVKTDTKPAISTISVRTARQLYHLSLYYPDYAEEVKNSSFLQERDIDYPAYTEEGWKNYAGVSGSITVQEPIGVRGTQITPFTAIYDGDCHEIRGISFSTNATAVGFIAQNNKLIRDVFLVADYSQEGSDLYLKYQGTISANKSVYMGALTGINSGRIQNCAVSGYSISGSNKVYVRSNGNFYFGGLAGSNSGTIQNCEADTPLLNSEILYGNAYMAGFAGENASGGIIRNSYAIGHIMVENAKGGKTAISGFTSRNAGSLSGDYCAVVLTASGSTTKSYGFAPKGGSINANCSYLSDGTFRYLGELYAFDNTSGAGTRKNYDELAADGGNVDESYSHYHSATNETAYPFKGVVTNTNEQGAPHVHYGNWEMKEDLGAIGIVYWELEQGGSNDGYHFSYIGYQGEGTDTLKKISGSTLCTQHDDGGIVTQYGYGYYYKSVDESEDWNVESALGEDTPDGNGVTNFKTGDVNADASIALSKRLPGFTVVAYTTKPSIGNVDSDNYMRMTANNRSEANGIWKFKYQGLEYTFTINPFFADAIQYGTADDSGVPKSLNLVEDGVAVQADETYDMPGTENNKYEIRSDDQLQYLNWNCNTQNATTMIEETKTGWGTSQTTTVDTAMVEGYTYLGYMYTAETATSTDGGNRIGSANYYWNQTHDVDADMDPVENIDANVNYQLFTPIGSLYDINGGNDGDNAENAKAYMSYFNGHYNGNTYSIKNIEINSGNISVGLFGSIIGAKVSNLILYSDKGNYIQRTSNVKTWYVLGGLCGIAAVGQNNPAGSVSIVNCTVSGYKIKDNSTKSAWGDACIGGMFGMSTLDLKNCSAVNEIILNEEYTGESGSKSDGVSVRTGGLVGSMRGNVINCYTGGKITIEKRCLDNTYQGYGAKIFLGGITGGICMKSGNFLELLGSNVMGVTVPWESDTDHYYTQGTDLYNQKPCGITTTCITNCYTYIQMPLDDTEYKAVKSIEPIGSNGETPCENKKNYHVKVEVNNCYYYKENIRVKHFTVKDSHDVYKGYIYNDPNYGERDWTNIVGEAVGLSWKQMAGKENITDDPKDTLVSRLGSAFSKVTTSENGQNVDGKYTFPGNSTYLEGENFPFPTVLKQDGTINVHYGEWPLEGIYWEESRATMDIFEDLQLEEDSTATDAANNGWAVKEFKLLDPVPVLSDKLSFEDFEFSYSNGEKDTVTEAFSDSSEDTAAVFSDGTELSEEAEGFSSGGADTGGEMDTASVSAADVAATGENEEPGTVELSDADRIAEVTAIRYDDTSKCYVATVRALKTGATIITVVAKDNQNNEYRASFNLSVSADLTVSVDPSTVEIGASESKEVAVHAGATAVMSAGGVSTTEMSEVGQAADSDGWGSDNSTEELMISDSVAGMEVFASGTVAAQTDLASRMKWNIEIGDEDYIKCLPVENGKFKVTSQAELTSPITLTITGIYTYNGIDYSDVAWVEVKPVNKVRWEKDTERVQLTGTGTTATFKLLDESGRLADTPALASFTVETYSAPEAYADENGVMVQGTGQVVNITAVEAVSGGYNITMAISNTGTFKVTFNGRYKDGEACTTSFILTADSSDIQNQSGNTDEIISSDTPQEDPGFTSDATDSQGGQSSDSVDMVPDQNNTSTDMVPDQNTDDFSDESSGWES